MAEARYVAVMERGLGETYGVWFPDFPGVVGAGNSEAEARASATEGLVFHLEGMAEDGDAPPRPSSIHVLGSEDVGAGFEYLFLVDVDTPNVKEATAQRINITLPEHLIARIDAVSEGNRSGWLAEAARDKLRAITPRRSLRSSAKDKRRA